MRKIRILLICLIFLAVVIVCLPLLLPLNSYKPQLEKRLSLLLQAQIQLGAIEFSYQPLPVFLLKDVKIDNEAGKIAQINVPLNIFNLLHRGNSLKNVEAEGVRLSPAFAFSLPTRFAALEQGRIKLGDVLLKKASVVWEQSELGPIDGVLKFADNGAITDLQLADEQGHIEVHITPRGANIGLTMQANRWELPLGYPLMFEKLYMSGEGSPDGLVIDDIRGEAYGGVIRGKAKLTWQKDWLLQGQLMAKGVHGEPLSKIFSPSTFVSGRIDMDAGFNYRAADYLKLFAHPQIDADLFLKDGALHNFDLITQLRAGDSVAGRGGQTRFDTLKAKMLLRDRTLQLQNISLNAGKFTARGGVRIGEKGVLNGSVAAHLQSGVLAISNQIRISGDLSRPALSSGAASRGGLEEPAEIIPQS